MSALIRADNGWRGSVEYQYTKRELIASECNFVLVCTKTNQGNERRIRFPVGQSIARDGRGNKLTTQYQYGKAAMRGEGEDSEEDEGGDPNSTIDKYEIQACEFLGYEQVTVISYDAVAESQSPTSELRYEVDKFWLALAVSPNGSGQAVPRVHGRANNRANRSTLRSKPAVLGGRC